MTDYQKSEAAKSELSALGKIIVVRNSFSYAIMQHNVSINNRLGNLRYGFSALHRLLAYRSVSLIFIDVVNFHEDDFGLIHLMAVFYFTL